MESNNLHNLQDQPPSAVEPSSSSNLSTPSSCSYGGTTHSWTPNITLNAGNSFNLQEANQRSRASIRVPLNDSMIQDLGYHNHWTSDAESRCLSSSNNQFSKIKEEISVANFPHKFSEMLNNSMEGYGLIPSSSSTSTTTQMMKNNIDQHTDALNDKLLLKTLFSGDFYSTTSPQNYPNNNFGTGGTSRGNFSQIYPSINISNFNHSSTSLDMSTQSLDLLTSPTSFTSGLSHHSQDHNLGTFTNNLSFRLHQMQHPIDRSSCSNSSNASHFTNGMAETKRPCTLMESKVPQSQSTASKKSRLESPRPSCPPFKVRKEKLGDRIAALQQLVAPFGKTDTASVLMEAIGYIKFLQGQVETLSVPYMKSSQNQINRVMQGGSEANGEPKQDLRSRGLCLVPLSCMSYIAGDGGSDVWQQPNFGRPT